MVEKIQSCVPLERLDSIATPVQEVRWGQTELTREGVASRGAVHHRIDGGVVSRFCLRRVGKAVRESSFANESRLSHFTALRYSCPVPMPS